MVEFVVVLIAIFMIAGLGRGYFTTLKEVIRQHYRSYCFSVAISDPPEGDREMKRDSDDDDKTMLIYEQMLRGTPEADR